MGTTAKQVFSAKPGAILHTLEWVPVGPPPTARTRPPLLAYLALVFTPPRTPVVTVHCGLTALIRTQAGEGPLLQPLSMEPPSNLPGREARLSSPKPFAHLDLKPCLTPWFGWEIMFQKS
jgi:hypothetical protein